jgi:hypothetical protein
MRRHAFPQQKALFELLGAPYLAIRVLLSEGRRGNIRGFQGLLRGAFDFLKSSLIRTHKTKTFHVLPKKSKAIVEEGTIAPAKQDQLRSVRKSYKLYSFIHPIYWLISKLDLIFFHLVEYVVMVEGKRG